MQDYIRLPIIRGSHQLDSSGTRWTYDAEEIITRRIPADGCEPITFGVPITIRYVSKLPIVEAQIAKVTHDDASVSFARITTAIAWVNVKASVLMPKGCEYMAGESCCDWGVREYQLVAFHESRCNECVAGDASDAPKFF